MSKLTPADHKQIAMSIVGELHKVLADHNGSRLLAKHAARTAPHADPSAVPPEDDDMSALADSEPTGEHELPGEPDEVDKAIPQLRKKHAPPFAHHK